MSKHTTDSKKRSRGGSPKKSIKRLRRKAVATLRHARLTAQLELLAAEAAAAQIREQALAAAADETATVRADAHAEIGRTVEQSRVDTLATATAEARALVAEAELKAARITRDAEVEGRARREQIVAEAMQEAATIRGAATEEIAGFLRRLDDERARLLETAREEAARVVTDTRAAAAIESARMRDATEQELAIKAREILDAATNKSRQVIERASAEARATRDDADALAAAATIAPTPPSPTPAHVATPIVTPVVTPAAPPTPKTSSRARKVSESPATVRWRAESAPTNTVAAESSEMTSTNGMFGEAASNGASTNGVHDATKDVTAAAGPAASDTGAGETEITVEPPTKKRRWGIFGRAR